MGPTLQSIQTLGFDGDIPAVKEPIRVVIADDHPGMRYSLRLLLDAEQEFDVVAEAADLTTALCHLVDLRPEVLILDLQLSNGSGVEAVERFLEQAPAIRIVVISMEDHVAFAELALTAGAIGFVIKDTADEELTEAVRCAA